MKVFLDTNIILDTILDRPHSDESDQVLARGVMGKFEMYTSFLSIANLAYVLRKMPQHEMLDLLSETCSILNVISMDGALLNSAISRPFDDFEDGLQYQSAMSEGCDCVVTNNVKDWHASTIPVYSSLDFLQFLSK